jgi:murein tripeptide amidase MpaA
MSCDRSALPILVALALSSAAVAQTADHLESLPPVIPWDGASRALVVGADDPWRTPCEASGLTASPSYDETVAWLEALVAAAPELEMVSLGKSLEGRDVWMVIASADGAFTPGALRDTGKPTLLAQAGIHSGEIDGKDAGMMLLRDMTVGGTKRALLEGANLLFVPILNVDGHERRSPHSRINQRGPSVMGWRTNARNLNLNRDYAKLDIPELRAVIRALAEWEPDLYFDLHVTDGIDYQYDITFGANGPHGYSPAIGKWFADTLMPAVSSDLTAQGHVPGPLIFAVDDNDLSQGIVNWTATPRYSNGYGDARHLPTLLVENHSLKPYDQRVLGTYVLLVSTLRVLANDPLSLRIATGQDRYRRPSEVAVSWRVADRPPETTSFLGVKSRVVDSPVTGTPVIQWLGKPVTVDLPHLHFDEPDGMVAVPEAYLIPPTWPEVIERLAYHGIEMQRFERGRDVEVEMLRLTEPVLGEAPFEGHVMVTCTPVPEFRTERFPAGTMRVSTDQPLGILAVLLLEPSSEDSFFQWGFFHEVLQRTEYQEAYVMEPMARRMLEADPELKRAFEEKLASDEEFAKDARARLEWFYARTPYFDERWQLYPVARVR